MLQVWLVHGKHNKHSLAALAGALEVSEAASTTVLRFPRFDEPHPPPEPEAGTTVLASFSFCTMEFEAVSRHARTLKARMEQNNATCITIAGGPHASGDPAGTLRAGFDIVVAGEGEEAFPKLVSRLASCEPPAGVAGVCFMDGPRLVREKPARPVNLDDYPSFSARFRRFAPIELTRGCPHGCLFCQTSYFMGRQERHRSVDCVMDQVRSLRSCGIKHLRFGSPNAFSYLAEKRGVPNTDAIERLLAGASEIFGRENVFFGTFPSEVRPEWVTRAALDVVTRYTATSRIVVGLQSGSDTMLKRMRRGHSVGDVFRAVELIAKAGLEPVVDLVFGLPGENSEDRAATMAAMERLVAMGATLHGHTFMPLPGTPLQDAPPGRLDRDTKLVLERLAGSGRLFGSWKSQEKLGRNIVPQRPAGSK